MNEVWIPVKGYEEFYEISSFGRLRSLDRFIERKSIKIPACYLKKGRILKGTIDDERLSSL
jgi:hypothetical protein